MQRLGAPLPGTRAQRQRLQAGCLSRASAAANPARRASGGAGRGVRGGQAVVRGRPCRQGSPLLSRRCPPSLVTRGMLLLALGSPRVAGLRLGGPRAAPWAATALQGPRAAVSRAASCSGSWEPVGRGSTGLRATAPLLLRPVRAQVGRPRAGGSKKGWESVGVVGTPSPRSLTALHAPAAGCRAEEVPCGAGGSNRPQR